MEKVSEIDRIIAENILSVIGTDYGSQKKLADKAKVNTITVNRILKLKQRAGRDVIVSIAKALGVSEADLYQRRKPDAPPLKASGHGTIADAVLLLQAFEKAEQRIRDDVFRLLGISVAQSADEIISRVAQTPKPKTQSNSSNGS